MTQQAFSTPKVEYDTILFGGGLDQVTPVLMLKTGTVTEAQNWECSITGGYSRIAGYERFDGHPSPSDANYIALTVALTGSLATSDTVTGVTSGATGVVVLIDDSTIVLTKIAGAFATGEILNVGGTPRATLIASGTTVPLTAVEDATYTALAADAYRTDIAKVPGSGMIRGVVYFGGTVYAWRDNAGGTALAMYKSSSSGWLAVALGFELSFSTGLVAGIVDGNTVTGLTSGATGVVTRVVLQSGTFGAGTGAGRLIFASITGTFQAGEALRVAGSTRATCVAAQSAITLLPGGRIETYIGNSAGGTNGKRIYGCDGVNRGFEFDGTVYVPIATGMTVDTPDHVCVHKSHVFFSFGPSLQFSGLGLPYQWSPVVGAGEAAMKDDVTALSPLPGDSTTAALGVYTPNDIAVLYGTSSADFDLKSFDDGGGAKQYSVQKLSDNYCFDTNGVSSLRTSVAYGNFSASSISLRIRPFVQPRRNNVTASVVNYEKSQYRVFFSDGYGLYVTVVNGKVAGMMPVFFPNEVRCICEGDLDGSTETAFFGSSDGYVYRLGVGTSFDGAVIDSFFTLAWNSQKAPRALKRYFRGALEVAGNSYAAFLLSYQLGYGLESGEDREYDAGVSTPYWDQFTWDDFYWDGRSLTPSEFELEGSAENIALRIACSSQLMLPFTINSAILHFAFRRPVR